MLARTLRPGFLISLKTAIKGGVAYQRIDLDPEHPTRDGGAEARWETHKRIEDRAEFERATQSRNKARAIVQRVCVASEFGLLCPLDRESDLESAIFEAREVARQFNASARTCEVGIFVISGRVASDDLEAARAISSEIRDLLGAMDQGIKAADPEAIRAAANKARQIGAMLSPEAARKVSAAVEEARKAAREIVKRVEKSGEVAATVLEDIKIEAIRDARAAFLDLDSAGEIGEAAPTARGLDLAPAGVINGAAPEIPISLDL